MILDYNATKGAVNTFDKMVKSYTCARSTRRWPMRLFFFLVDIACLNTSVVWFTTHPEWKRKESYRRRSFLSAVAYDMITEQKVEHRCAKCQQFVCGKHGKKTVVSKCVVCPPAVAV